MTAGTPWRLTLFPNAPTKMGLGKKDFGAGDIHGFWAHEGLPAAIVEIMDTEINRASRVPNAAVTLKAIGVKPHPMTAVGFGAVTKADARRFTQIIQE